MKIHCYGTNTWILLALVSGSCWWFKKKQDSLSKSREVYRILLVILFVTLIITGHNGGSMTHGNDLPMTSGWLFDSDTQITILLT